MTEFTIDTLAFRQALTTALAFASSDDTLPQVHAVRIASADKHVIEIAATDRYVLSVEKLPVDGEPFDTTIPYGVAKQLLTLLPKPRRGQIIDSLLTLTQDGGRVTVRVVGNIETALTFTPPDDSVLMAKTEQGAEDPAPVMGFGPKILTNVCRTLAARDGTTPMRLRFRGARKPVTVEHGDLKVLVMPVRLDDQDGAESTTKAVA
jgi:hypothetical protein